MLAIALDPQAAKLRAPSLPAGGPNAEEPNQRYFLRHESLHPFLGFVQNPGVHEVETARGRLVKRSVTEHGFIDKVAYAGEGQNTVEVVVLGGSVALALVSQAGDMLATELSQLPRYKGRRIRVRNLAMGGYKQPQQLIAFIWELSLGNKIDLVVNLDGYNDLVLAHAEALQGVFPLYPRGWRWRVQDTPDAETQAAVDKVVYTRSRQERVADSFRESPLARSSMATYIWMKVDQLLASQVAAAEEELRAGSATLRREFGVTGPPFQADVKDYPGAVAAVWARCSLQMAALARGMGIEYHHFLQPNQHDENAKPLSSQERAEAELATRGVIDLVRSGYPLLSAEGAKLRAEGVQFHDLRGLFAQVEETLYVDSCCHLGSKGNELLAKAVARAIRDAD